MRPSRSLQAFVLLSLLTLISCDRTPATSAADTEDPGATSASQPTDAELDRVRGLVREIGSEQKPPTLPPTHPPINTQTTPKEPSAAVKPLKFTSPPEWQRQRVTSRMRIDQYLLPRVDGDDEDGELAVFFFAGAGGSVADNVRRWRGQFTAADGQPVGDDAVTQETLEMAGRQIALVDIKGEYHAIAMMPGRPRPPARPGQRMLAAIVETPGGRMIFKAVGPEATMTHHRAGLLQLLESLADH